MASAGCCVDAYLGSANRLGAPMGRVTLCSTLAVSILALVTLANAESTQGIPEVVSPNITPELVQEGFQFTEGPLARADGSLLFTDIRANQIYQVDLADHVSGFRTQTKSANGLALTRSGELLAAEGDGRRIGKARLPVGRY